MIVSVVNVIIMSAENISACSVFPGCGYMWVVARIMNVPVKNPVAISAESFG